MKKILVAAKREDLREAFRIRLEELGYSTVIAVDDKEAKEIIYKDGVDGVVLDYEINNDGRGGRELLYELSTSADPSLKNLPVIFCSLGVSVAGSRTVTENIGWYDTGDVPLQPYFNRRVMDYFGAPEESEDVATSVGGMF